MAKVKTHTFNGRKYTIDFFGPVDGLTDTFNLKDRHLAIMAEAKTQDELITIIHECLHAENWCKSHKVIERVSTEIGTFLWRLGYRRRKERK